MVTMYLRSYALWQEPALHCSLILHVLDLLLQCVLVHGCHYTGVHLFRQGSAPTPAR